MTQFVSDEVWTQLDPNVGRLPRRTTWRLAIGAALALLVLAAASAVWRSGLVTNRLVWDDMASHSASATHTFIEHSVEIRNTGWVPITILGAAESGPGLRLDRIDGSFPMTVEPDATVSFVVRFTVTDCAAIPTGAWPMPVRVDRWWGEQTVLIDIPPMPDQDAPAFQTYIGEDPNAIPWQRQLTKVACGR